MATAIDSKIDTQDNLFKSFFRAALVHDAHIIFKSRGGRDKSFSYTEVLNLASAFGAGIQELCKDETEIGLLSENRPEWPISYLAILSAGKTVVPIDSNLKDEEICNLIRIARLKTVIVSEKFEQIISKKCNDVKVISFSDKSQNFWKNFFRSKTISAPIDINQTAALIYTSGTTGTPKAVMLTHANLLCNLNSVEKVLNFGEQDVFLSVLPLHHTFEATAGFLTPVINGAKIVYARSLKSKNIVEDIKHNGVTIMCGVPLLFEKMYQAILRKVSDANIIKRVMFNVFYALSLYSRQFGKNWGRFLFRGMRQAAGLNTIRLFVSGGAPLPKRIAEFFNLVGFTLLEGYGMTECSPVVTVNLPENIVFGSVGPPLPDVEVAINKPNPEGVGEIIVRGGNVTPGYKDNPEKTAELVRGGWLYTGDLGKFENGHLFITGRAKNLIVSAAGKNIYPEEIEEKLLHSPFVLETVVVGRKKENKQGEDVIAIIVPDKEQFAAHYELDHDNPDMTKITEVIKQVVADVNASMADYKRITSYDIELNELEKTSTKKVKRFVYG